MGSVDDVAKIDKQLEMLEHSTDPEESLDQGDVVFDDSQVLGRGDTKKVYQIEDLSKTRYWTVKRKP